MVEQIKKAFNGRSKTPTAILFLVIAVVVVVLVLLYLRYHATHISTDDAFVEGKIHMIASKVSGTIKGISIQDNQFVKKDDPLFEIDPVDYDVKVKEAQSSYEAEKAKFTETAYKLDVARKQAVQIGAAIETAKANKDLAEANLKQAKADMKRAENLLKEDAISKERYEKTRTALDVSEAQLKAALERTKELEASLQTQLSLVKQNDAGLAAQRAVVETKKATMESAQLNRGYTKILAPADGYVTRKAVEIGNQIVVGQPLCAIVPLEDIWIVANFKETQVAKIKVGQKVDFKVDTYSGRTFRGSVDSIMAGTGASFSLFPPENATGNYVKVVQRIPIKIILDKGTDKDHVLRLGMSVQPTVIAE
ncbi:MAG TPA: HlyD family secretion protein [Syntrophorhabdaceae bacterium]|nr:HlyD family secretion protein [Syntrophorhabdaceae bacterium]